MDSIHREWEQQVEKLIEEMPKIIESARKDPAVPDLNTAIAMSAAAESSKLFLKMLERYDMRIDERFRKLEKQAGRAITRRDTRLAAENETAASLAETIRGKRKYAEVHTGIGRIVDPEVTDVNVLIQSFLNQFDCFQLNPELKESDSEDEIRTLLEYAISKQMVHGFEAMSREEAQPIIDRFLGMFDAARRKIFTNATYENGWTWSSIMKERWGTVYFDTGIVVIDDDLIGVLWIADPG